MTAVDLRNWVVSAQYPIYERVAVIAEHVAPSTWCVIGGLMTELVLAERGSVPVRTTTDGDVLGHLAVDPDVMSKIELVLTEQLGMKLCPTGEGIACRYQDSGDESLFIDVLVPSRARAADGTPKRLAAPGTGDEQFLATLSMRTVTFSEAHAPFEARYPSLAGAFYAKATAWRDIDPPPEAEPIKKEKHLTDAIALALSASADELAIDRSKGFRSRLVLVRAEAVKPSPTIQAQFTSDELARVVDIIDLALEPTEGA